MKTPSLLAGSLGFAWLFVSVGRFLAERVPMNSEILFWLLWASLVANAALAAYLFDSRRTSGRPPVGS